MDVRSRTTLLGVVLAGVVGLVAGCSSDNALGSAAPVVVTATPAQTVYDKVFAGKALYFTEAKPADTKGTISQAQAESTAVAGSRPYGTTAAHSAKLALAHILLDTTVAPHNGDVVWLVDVSPAGGFTDHSGRHITYLVQVIDAKTGRLLQADGV